jgi:integrase
VNELTAEIRDLIRPLSREQIKQCRAGILSVLHQVGVPLPAPAEGSHTLEYAYERWHRMKDKDRDAGTIYLARRHFDAFVKHSGLVMLDQVRRSHLMNWRDSLSDASPPFAVNSINQRINLVSAILRAGWRDAEMAEQNLKALTFADTDDNARASWEKTEILAALHALKPNSWSAWLYLISLTTSVRIGEPMAARVSWFDPKTGMIEVVDRRYTKPKKLHCMPILAILREPLVRYIGNRSRDDYLFPDAPRPANPSVLISHESSKWFGRFFHKHGINRVFHELRDTWIEAAKHSTVEKDIWEIISGHSKATMSDRYGGKKPNVLSNNNETVCKFLTDDTEIITAMLALVA